MGKKEFSVGDLVLKWEKSDKEKGQLTKLQPLWIGPFFVREKLGHHTYFFQYLDGNIDSLHLNGQYLKQYSQ